MKTFPINLLLNDKSILIIGGGKVASRKLLKLIADTDSKISILSPEISSTIAELAEKNSRIKLIKEKYQDSFLEENYLVFATSDDRSLNSQIIKDCESRNILVCAVDKNWVEGRFITPASFAKDDVTISISTQGQSCRKTKLVKDSLSRHIELINNAELMIIGTDHNYLSLNEREHLHLVNGKLEKIAEMVMHIWGIHEFMLLNTCNRIELIAVVSQSNGIEDILKKILGFEKIDKNDFYIKYGMEAFEHLATSAAGLLSQTPGEKHIVSQLKEAIKIAKEKNWAGSIMQEWIDSTLHISKQIRKKVEPIFHQVEIEGLAIKYLKTEYESLKNKNVLIIGTGEIGQGVLASIKDESDCINWCYHKNIPEKSDNIKIYSLNEIRNILPEIDIVISATASSVPIIHRGHAPFFDISRKINMIDLSIPRNISNDLKDLMANITIMDLDDLKHWHRRENCDMSEVYTMSKKIIKEHSNRYQKIIFSLLGKNKSNLK